jgi:hypothetical protein
MDRATAAEWMLARVVEQSRASEIMGDLLETRPEQGSLRFWLSVLGLLISFTWRPVVGLVLAYFAALFSLMFSSLRPIMELTKQRSHFQFGSAGYLTNTYWTSLTIQLGSVTTLLWIVAGYAVVRFGIRNTSSQMSIGTALMGTVLCSYLWIPDGRPALLAVSALVAAIALINERRRQSLGIVLGSVAIAWVVGHLCPFWRSYPETSVLIVAILVPLVEVVVFNYLHTMLTSSRDAISPEAL